MADFEASGLSNGRYIAQKMATCNLPISVGTWWHSHPSQGGIAFGRFDRL